MKVDMHVHSSASSRPSEWILQKLKCPESFTEPRQLYDMARSRGMTHVTITDHNSLDGILQIAHLPNTFISVELTTYFPEDGCKLHVLVYGLNEAQFDVCQKIRRNVYDLVEYLNEQQLFHAVAHPLFSINGKLTYAHFEKLLILFQNLELNGSRNDELNDVLRLIAAELTPEMMSELMDRYGVVSPHAEPWKKNFVGGSDDHGSLHIACRWTEVIGAYDFDGLVEGIQGGRGFVAGGKASPHGFARTLYSIAYQFYRRKLALSKNKAGQDNIILTMLGKYLLPSESGENEPGLTAKIKYFFARQGRRKKPLTPNAPLFEMFSHEIYNLIEEDAGLAEIFHHPGRHKDLDQTWCEIITHISNRILTRFNTRQLKSLFQARFFDMIQSIGSVAMLYFVLSPYFLAFSLFSKDIQFSRNILARFRRQSSGEKTPEEDRDLRVAHFTDTFYDMNGVARTIARQLAASRRSGKSYQVITCASEKCAVPEGVRNFKPIATFKFEEYRDQKLYYPPFLEMLDYCYKQKFTHIHSSTPGPIGLAALGIAKTLKLPLIGTYHTAFPQYARYFTEDNAIEGMMWKYMIWYYQQMDLILVPSKATLQELAAKGIPLEKMKIFPRGVDAGVFSPRKRNGFFNGTSADKKIRLLYAGRVSVEKNLTVLSDAYRILCSKRSDVALVVTGKGPYIEQMRKECAGLPIVFTGHLDGEALAEVFASSDLFVFPSETDTFGNVVLEAQASGIPVMVTPYGGPCENVIAGETGWVVDMKDGAALCRALEEAISNPGRLRQMGSSARKAMEARGFDASFDRTWKLYGEAAIKTADLFPEDSNFHLPDELARRLVVPL